MRSTERRTAPRQTKIGKAGGNALRVGLIVFPRDLLDLLTEGKAIGKQLHQIAVCLPQRMQYAVGLSRLPVRAVKTCQKAGGKPAEILKVQGDDIVCVLLLKLWEFSPHPAGIALPILTVGRARDHTLRVTVGQKARLDQAGELQKGL